MKAVVGVSFESSRIYYFDPNGHNLKSNLTVIVETEQGMQFGTVKIPLTKIEESKIKKPLKKIIRISTNKDYKQYKKNQKDSAEAKEMCQKLAKEQNLNIKILDASYTFDRDKLIFRFLSDNRIDFRELAKDLAKIYRVRIELRQIGVRDKAKETGGFGPCGRKLCCSTFLKDLDAVSINMAKNQNIALNPSKINGICGRLLCCLKYENECYKECMKTMPQMNKRIKTNKGEGKVISMDVLKGTYKVNIPEVGIVEFSKDSNEGN